MKSFVKPTSTLILSVFLLSQPLDAQETSNPIPNDQGLNIEKLSSMEHKDRLSFFAETGRLETYEKDLRYPLESPFGVYVVYENEEPIAIQGFSVYQKSNALIASAVTDVLEKFQGQRYGTRLRTATARFLEENYLGKIVTVNINDQIISQPLLYLHSCNEWMWGENIQSLKSSLSAGYQIACVGGSQTVQMLYTKDETLRQNLWSTERTEQLIAFASLMQGGQSFNTEKFSLKLTSLLHSLDFTQEVDIATFLNFHMKSVAEWDAEQPWYLPMRTLLRNFIAILDAEQINTITNFAREERIDSIPQKIPADLLDFCIGSYNYWLDFIESQKS